MKNVVVIDIDGVLADYRLGLLYWIRQSWPSLASRANEHLKVSDTWIDAKTMGVSYREWLTALEMFRMSGGKQTLPLFDGSKDLIFWCMENKYEIVLLTSRPIDIYSNIYRDTIEWLRNNGIHHHLLLWSKNKAEIVHKLRLTDKILFAVDDELRHVQDYDALGVPTMWIDLYDTAKNVSLIGKCLRFTSMKGLVEFLTKGGNDEQTKSNAT